MFTGIIECLGVIEEIEKEQDNYHFTLSSPVSKALKIDQSIAHNGVCLTVVKQEKNTHVVTAIKETLDKTDLSYWQKGDRINLERCMQINGRLDGHIVQGHVDTIAECTGIEDQNGSYLFTFRYNSKNHITVEKGSITVNGVSLTVVDSCEDQFSVAIIPYTYKHTNLKDIKTRDKVNLEFDIIGKYVARLLDQRKA